jgi:hypothetical protein
MRRFVVHLGNGLAQLIWTITKAQAEQQARNLASYYATSILYIEEA